MATPQPLPTTTTTRHCARSRDVEAADGASFELPGSTTGHVTAERAGTVRFTLGGEPVSLSMFWLLDYAGGFFLSFRDATSAAARPTARAAICSILQRAQISGPTPAGALILDFNFAYQPSCSYDPRWSCPLPPRENWLTMPIRGGERLRP